MNWNSIFCRDVIGMLWSDSVISRHFRDKEIALQIHTFQTVSLHISTLLKVRLFLYIAMLIIKDISSKKYFRSHNISTHHWYHSRVFLSWDKPSEGVCWQGRPEQTWWGPAPPGSPPYCRCPCWPQPPPPLSSSFRQSPVPWKRKADYDHQGLLDYLDCDLLCELLPPPPGVPALGDHSTHHHLPAQRHL